MISSKIENQILSVVFEDDRSRNSLSLAAARALRMSLRSGDYDALVFSAKGRVFCSGGHLGDYGQMTEAAQGIEVNREISSILEELSLLPVPTFAGIEGDCFGGGVELLSAFDFVYSAPHALFGLWQRKIGLSFGWGGGARLEKRLGPHLLRRFSLSTDSITAEEALRLSLIDGIFPRGQVQTGIMERVGSMRKLPAAPVASLKRWVPEKEREIFEGLWWNDEHRSVLSEWRRRRNSRPDSGLGLSGSRVDKAHDPDDL